MKKRQFTPIYRASFAAVAASIGFAGCGDDEKKTPPVTEEPSIASIVADNPDFDTLETALSTAGLVETFAGTEAFTVFAPTDAAFEALPEGALDALLADKEALTEVLQYHVVSGEVDAATVVTLEKATTLLGKDVTITVKDGEVFLNDTVKVVTTDIAASNGIVHVIDAVLLPPEDVEPEPEPTTNTIVDIVVNGEDFDTLETAVVTAELAETLSGPGPFTVFAPTDAAFEALPEGLLEELLEDKEALTDILTYHVLSGETKAETVVTLPRGTSLNGVDFKITVDGSTVKINDTITVTSTDIEADNGVIHVIDAVMVPPKSIYDVVTSSADFSTLATAVNAAGLSMTLGGSDAYTVFAPTNAAIAALGDAVPALLANPAKLADVILHHATAGKHYADHVVMMTSAEMANGLTLPITVDGDSVKIGDAKIVTTDIYARNGVIHVIDAVLVPPPTIVDVAAADPRFSTLVTALNAAELTATLDGPGPFTVFAPTNDAFGQISSIFLDNLLRDKDALTDVLLFHVVDGNSLASDVVSKVYLTMKNGAIAPISTASGAATIAGALISTTDIKVRNGVIHVIDKVIMPPLSLVGVALSNPDFSTLATAVQAAGLADALGAGGPYTVFAPTNAAFAKIPEADLNALIADQAALTNVLLYHAADGVVPASVAVSLDKATMKNGAELDFTYNPEQMTLDVGPARVVTTDIWARNGVVHVIDTVLLPPSP
jgi:uncharacterized surface protein with fasciclin (FAS1) repeats